MWIWMTKQRSTPSTCGSSLPCAIRHTWNPHCATCGAPPPSCGRFGHCPKANRPVKRSAQAGRAAGYTTSRTSSVLAPEGVGSGTSSPTLALSKALATGEIHLTCPRLLSASVVPIFRAVPIAGRPMNDLDHLGTLVVDQVQQLCAQPCVSFRGDVVLASGRNRRQTQIIVLVRLGFLGKGFAHDRSTPSATIGVKRKKP